MATCIVYGDDQAFAMCIEAADGAVEQERGAVFQRIYGDDAGVGHFDVRT